MADTLSSQERSERMSRIRGSDTSPELLVRRYLHAHGLRYKLHDRSLPGKPDLVFPRHGVVVFINGCFWHAHHCQKNRIPATRSDFWKDKFDRNRTRDARNARHLKRLGWRVLTVWECTLSGTSKRPKVLDTLMRKIVAGTKGLP